jgi:hypothetical protein
MGGALKTDGASPETAWRSGITVNQARQARLRPG